MTVYFRCICSNYENSRASHHLLRFCFFASKYLTMYIYICIKMASNKTGEKSICTFCFRFQEINQIFFSAPHTIYNFKGLKKLWLWYCFHFHWRYNSSDYKFALKHDADQNIELPRMNEKREKKVETFH